MSVPVLPRALGTVLPLLPLLLVWALALWPVVMWLVHLGDPELAVVIAQGTSWLGVRAMWVVGGAAVVLCVAFPPALAWLRRTATRTWTSLTADPAPLHRARAELQHFANGPRHAEVGRLLRLRRQNAEALAHFRAAVELDPTLATAWHQIGLILFAQHHWEHAAGAFQRAEQLEPGHAFGDALLHLGRALHELRRPEGLVLLRQHERQHGGGPRSQLWLADALLRAGERDAALATLRQAAAPPARKLTAEENWFRALARVRLWGKGAAS